MERPDTYSILATSSTPTYLTNPPPPCARTPPNHTHTQGWGGDGGHNPRVEGGGDIPNSIVYYPSYDETMWRALRDKVFPMRGVLKRTTGLGLTLPPYPHDAFKESCPSYRFKGLCNSRYGRIGYHVP